MRATGKKTQRLERLARLLEPERMPYYVRRAGLPPGLARSFPADGWYWVPRGHHTAVYLAAGYEDAIVTLHRMIDELLDEANG